MEVMIILCDVYLFHVVIEKISLNIFLKTVIGVGKTQILSTYFGNDFDEGSESTIGLIYNFIVTIILVKNVR